MIEQQDIENELETRKLFIRVFDHPDGRTVLTAILNRLGYFSNEPQRIHPELIAAANWILSCCGVAVPSNLFTMVDRLMDSCTTADLDSLLKAYKEE